ncbi:hypothetical protein DC498_04500 [Terrimonas sp.]|uniref:DUF6520 family protein n=1 Tax=Terrimonas sp. TaxID=1914338 RepID=UPI000D50A319|nr:DUF6520 family protein [Terrimonas sp.]PVD53776.1 hypothetical protein DC498_04500 [Terrimonas sp.]
MKKIKFILPLIIVSVIAAFAFVAKKTERPNNKGKLEEKINFATTYFVFSGSSASEYTDSTKWAKHESNPSVDCETGTIACKVHSASLATRTALVDYIGTNGIGGTSITMDAKKP